MAVEGKDGGAGDGGEDKGGEGGKDGAAGADKGGKEGKDDGDGKGSEGGDDGKEGEDGKDGKEGDDTLLGGAGKDGKGDGGKDGKDGGKAGAPESYADFNLPEGIQVDAAGIESFKGVAKELNLSQEQAQKLVDVQVSMAEKEAEANRAEFEKTTSAWKSETEKVLGPNFKEELAFAGKAIAKFGGPNNGEALRKVLNEMRVGDHPEMAQFMVRVGKEISEDKMLDGKGSGGAKKSDGKLFYPNMEAEMKKQGALSQS